MSKKTFEEIENTSVRQLAKIVTKTKAWTESDPVYRHLDSRADNRDTWELWNKFQKKKEKQTKLRAELTRYMKRFAKANLQGKADLQIILASIVNDLAKVQEEFIDWKREVEQWLTTSNT
jgi:capsule polysaccharide export protein KpsE/RkpR